MLGGGCVVAKNLPGFTGTGFVDYPDNLASGYTEFSVSQTGARTFVFRYANGSTVSRPCDVTINGVKVDRMYFQPTGSWSTWSTVQTSLNLGAGTGAKAVRVTAVTTAGGPNLDSLTVK
jgi:endoglucanase